MKLTSNYNPSSSFQNPQTQKKPNIFFDILILFLLISGLSISFLGGFYLKSLLQKEKETQNHFPVTSTQPIPTQAPTKTANQNIDKELNLSSNLITSNFYYDDTIIILTKTKPYKALVVTATRNGKDNSFIQGTRASFYNGESWTRKIENHEISNSSISSNSIVIEWLKNIDPSRVLKESISGIIQINDSQIKFDTGPLFNEMATRSLPGYTKFMSQSSGHVTINNSSYPAYYLYSKIYSQNASDIQFYNTPFGLTTNWLVFWGNNDTFYHVDKTNVPNPTNIYQTHEIAIKKDLNNFIGKTFKVAVSRNSIDSPDSYQFNLGNPINDSLSITRLNSINKSPDGSYIWQMGIVEGTINSQDNNISGIGLIEYIHQ
jgi:hypothetical protein